MKKPTNRTLKKRMLEILLNELPPADIVECFFEIEVTKNILLK